MSSAEAPHLCLGESILMFHNILVKRGSKLSPKPSLHWLQPTLERPTLSSCLQLTVVRQYPDHYDLCKALHAEATFPPCTTPMWYCTA